MKFKIDKRTIIEEAQHAGDKDVHGISLDRNDIGNEETRKARQWTANDIRWDRKMRDDARKDYIF